MLCKIHLRGLLLTIEVLYCTINDDLLIVIARVLLVVR